MYSTLRDLMQGMLNIAIRAARKAGSIINRASLDGGALDVRSKRANDFVTRVDAAAVWGEHLAGVPTDATLELTERDRNRIFNLGYYTWVEQQGTPVELFERRRHQEFWRGLRAYLPVWDGLITDFNARVAALPPA